ncbi:hypothetical protein [Nocardioides sp. YIM 152315]|uniref:phage tail fiber protein n=1 Tax=Nocardioides sp. YIM 152315 TaxID=3031760 RepID=UPI0023DA0BE2|nr:hypothetical protein [Nocardioides sp. YIM 152315]MDF1603415.1 hypothetical protein [Nocardioides sp. YIM 152315]
MALTNAALNAAVEGITTQVTHIALTDGGTELTGGSYARQAVTWGTATAGAQNIAADETFEVPAGATVDGWVGYDALTGGTSYGGAALTAETYAGAGQYVLEAASTNYDVN